MSELVKNVIEVKELNFSYTEVTFLTDMNFAVKEGEIFGFLGPSGAGKSTLQKILTGLCTSYSGSARILGIESKQHNKGFYENIGVDFEFPSLYEKMTARENLRFIIPVFSLIHIDLKTILIMIVSTVLSGFITSLLVIAISSNKVEGMAIGKLSGGFGMILFVPLIIKGPVQYVFSLFPMFWIGKYIQDETWIALPLSLILFVGWIYCLMRKFRKKI